MLFSIMITKKRESQLAFLMFLIISFLSIGSYGLMYLLKFKIKASVYVMMKTLPDSALVEIKKAYVVGAENEREFIHDGKYYDVARHKIAGDSIYYYCYFDKAETNLAHLSSQWHSIDLVKDKRIQPNYLVRVSDIKYLPFNLVYTASLCSSELNFRDLIYPKYLVYKEVIPPPPRLT